MTRAALLELSPSALERATSLAETRRFWRHEGGGELAYRCYEGNGLRLWQAFTANAADYYVLRSEIELIAANAGRIAELARQGLSDGDHLSAIELGTGSRAALQLKTAPMVSALLPENFMAVDHSPDVLRTAKNFLKNQFPHLPVSCVSTDFNTEAIPMGQRGRRVMMQFGSTISNVAGLRDDPLPVNRLISSLRNYRRSLALGDMLVIGYDSNQDGSTAIAAYSHPAHAAFSLNLLYVMARDESIQGLEPEDFKYRATWHAAASLVSHDLVAKRSGEFLLQGERINYRAGEAFNYSNSYKYPVWVFEEAARKAGFEPKERMMDASNRVGLHLLKAH